MRVRASGEKEEGGVQVREQDWTALFHVERDEVGYLSSGMPRAVES